MSKSVKKCSIRVNFCHFLQTIKFALTPLQQRTKRNFTPKSCPSYQIRTYVRSTSRFYNAISRRAAPVAAGEFLSR